VRHLLLALDEPPARFGFRLAWSHWRRRHQAVARRCHVARRARRQGDTPVASALTPVPLPTPGLENGSATLSAELTEHEWRRLAPLLPRQKPPPGYPARDLRRMVAAMLWVERTGCSWRALPDQFGPWQDVYSRYHRWRKAGLWARILQTLDPEDAEMETMCA